jgi:hypothetical protein
MEIHGLPETYRGRKNPGIMKKEMGLQMAPINGMLVDDINGDLFLFPKSFFEHQPKTRNF